MSEIVVDIRGWVETAKSDRLRYRERQATLIVLTAIGMAPSIGNNVFLKGGVLMGVVHHSLRQTADLDFSTTLSPTSEIGSEIRSTFNEILPRAAAALGNPDLIFKVQSIEMKPRKEGFSTASYPALKVKIGYATRQTSEEIALEKGQSPTVVELDISFNEPVKGIEVVKLGDSGQAIQIYSLTELIAEKLRAQLQQVPRNRYRPQDFYDIALLLKHHHLSDDDLVHLLRVFKEKCRSRDIEPTQTSLEDATLIERAKSEWDSLLLELGTVPDFKECYEVVNKFYRNLPWDKA